MVFSTHKSYCIRESNEQHDQEGFHLSGMLPGSLYDADTQCKQQYGGVAKHCKYFKVCEQLEWKVSHL